MIVHDVVRLAQPRLTAELMSHDGADLGFVQAIARRDPFHLLCFATIHDQHPLHNLPIGPCFQQQRHGNNGIRGLRQCETAFNFIPDQGVKNGFQFFFCFGR